MADESDRAEAQKLDDAFRDKLLGSTCFCGAIGGVMRGKMENGAVVAIERRCAPLQCLAHGYCAAHSTPVAAQMTEDQKTRVMKRAGWMQR
jgi:hypothetical protein